MNIGSKSAEFVVGSDSIVTLTQKDSIVAYASLGSMLQKLMRDIEMSTQSKNVSKIAEKKCI